MDGDIIRGKPIVGKTYSLYGGEDTSDEFYSHLRGVTDKILNDSGRSDSDLLEFISSLSRSRQRIRKSERGDAFTASLLEILRSEFSKYFTSVEEHLKSLTLRQRFDQRLATTFEQYLLYILEIELTNRINLPQFADSTHKLAFLPHCLRDFSKNCMASPDEIDYLCRGCSKGCTISTISRMLKKAEITPYIWMKADLKKVFRNYKNSGTGIGVIGIACIPELVFGMRLCRKYNVPVTGIPLNANRCSRWMGDFYDNSVNLGRLNSLTCSRPSITEKQC